MSLGVQCPFGETPMPSYPNRACHEQPWQEQCDGPAEHTENNYWACSVATHVAATYYQVSSCGYSIVQEEHHSMAMNLISEYSQDKGLSPVVTSALLHRSVCGNTGQWCENTDEDLTHTPGD